MEVFRWIVCLSIGAPSALLIPLNWLSFFGWLVKAWNGQKGGHSFAPPFLCGIALAIACLVCPWPGVWWWAWLALLLDLSITLFLVCFALQMVKRFFRL